MKTMLSQEASSTRAHEVFSKSRSCVSVVIVSWNTSCLLRRCLETLKQELQGLEHEVFVVDNDSSDDSAAMVANEHPWVQLIANQSNKGFACANNQAIELSCGNVVLLLNPDTEVLPGSIQKLLRFLEEKPCAGVVAPQLINTDGTIQRSCRQFPTFTGMLYELMGLSRLFLHKPRFRQYKMLDWNHNDERQVDQPEGACLLVRREVIDQVGLLDEDFFMLFEEVDWCYRIKQAGWEIWFEPQAKVIHHYGQSIKQVRPKMIFCSHQGLYRFWKKHYRGHHFYLDWFAYAGLMCLALLRVGAYQVKTFSGKLF
ncbi:MAG: glycosyltransferase family 2 protein [Candidatus Melainabacteria bacterium]|nr:glycosyltransferase family 2 protein [Candidatus Melainabacteria bacterium]